MTSNALTISTSKTAWGNVGRESLGFVPAEFVSMGVSLGVVAVADTLAPNLIKTASKALGRIVFEPFLDYIEAGLGAICKLDECKVDKSKPRSERAENLAHTTLVFGTAWAASMVAKLETRRFLNNKLGVEDHAIEGKKWWQPWKMTTREKIIIGADEGVHYGSLLLFNTGAAKTTDHMIKAGTEVLTGIGFSKQNAHNISAMAMVWELPNLLGLMSGLGAIAGIHHHHIDQKLDNWMAKKPASKVSTVNAFHTAADVLDATRAITHL